MLTKKTIKNIKKTMETMFLETASVRTESDNEIVFIRGKKGFHIQAYDRDGELFLYMDDDLEKMLDKFRDSLFYREKIKEEKC